MWRERRWRVILDYVDELPTASRLWEAFLNDPVIARQLASEKWKREMEDGEEEERWTPPLSEFDLQAKLLRDLIQSVLGLQEIVASANGNNLRNPDYPLPVTEVDRILVELNHIWAQNLLSRFGFSPEDF